MSRGVIPFPMKPTGGGELPAGFVNLPFVRFIGLLNTDIIPTQTNKITIDCIIHEYKQYATLFASYTDENSTCQRIILGTNNNSQVLMYFNSRAAGGGTHVPYPGLGKRCTMAIEAGKAYVDSVEYNIDTSLGTPSRTFYFGASSSTYTVDKTIYSFTITENGRATHKLIPAKNVNTGAECLFDIVTRKPYYI